MRHLARIGTIAAFLWGRVAHAQGLQEAQEALEKAGQTAFGRTAETDPVVVAGRAINAFLAVLGILFVFLTIYGGYLWMTARGDEQRVEKAKDTLTAAVIGIAIILAAYAISSFVVRRLVEAAAGG